MLKGRTYYLQANASKELQSWIMALTEHARKNGQLLRVDSKSGRFYHTLKTSQESLKEGILQKRSGTNRHVWQKRFVVLESDTRKLIYYRTEADRKRHIPLGEINLRDVLEIGLNKKGKGADLGLRFDITMEGIASGRIYCFMADSNVEAQNWVNLLSTQLPKPYVDFEETENNKRILPEPQDPYHYKGRKSRLQLRNLINSKNRKLDQAVREMWIGVGTLTELHIPCEGWVRKQNLLVKGRWHRCYLQADQFDKKFIYFKDDTNSKPPLGEILWNDIRYIEIIDLRPKKLEKKN